MVMEYIRQLLALGIIVPTYIINKSVK